MAANDDNHPAAHRPANLRDRDARYPVGYVVGVFDLLHEGHRHLLRRVAALCHKLVIAVHTDEFTAAYKTRPHQDQETRRRALVFSGLLPESTPVLVVGPDHEPIWREYGVTHVLHGDDWDRESYIDQIGRAAVERCGVEIVLLPATRGISSSMFRADKTYFDNKHLVVFDIDGTIALGKRALPGAVELIEALRALNIRVAYISNDSGFTKQVKAERLRAAGIPVLDENKEFFTPLDSILLHLEQSAYKRVYLAATPEIKAWFARFGIEHEERAPELLVLCRDTTLDYAKLSQITQLLYRGVPYIASNPDSFYPTPEGPGVDLAGLIELIAVTTGGVRPLRVFGKPDVSMLDAAARPRDISPANVLMIGDRLHTDIRMAQEYGCDSVVVLTGDTTREKLVTARDVRPTYVAEGVHILAEQLRSRRVDGDGDGGAGGEGTGEARQP